MLWWSQIFLISSSNSLTYFSDTLARRKICLLPLAFTGWRDLFLERFPKSRLVYECRNNKKELTLIGMFIFWRWYISVRLFFNSSPASNFTWSKLNSTFLFSFFHFHKLVTVPIFLWIILIHRCNSKPLIPFRLSMILTMLWSRVSTYSAIGTIHFLKLMLFK